MANGNNDWFSSGLGSVAAQQPIWPMPQGWQRPQQPLPDQGQQRTGFWYGNPPQWLNNLGQGLSNLAGDANAQDYLGAISLAKVGKPDPWGGQAFHMMNEQGEKVGDLEAHMAEPDLLKIDWEGSGRGSHALGFVNSRSVLPELLREYPDMKRYTAYRVSGARHGPAASFKGLPGEGGNLPYMQPIKNVPGHIKPNPPNQWSGKWLHEDSGQWLSDAEEDPAALRRRRINLGEAGRSMPELDRVNRLLESLRGNQLMQESEHEEVPPALSQRVLDAARAREGARQPVNTPEELRNLDQNIGNWRAMQNRFNEQSRVGTVRTPPTPPAPQPVVISPNYGFNPTRYGVPKGQQTPGPFTAQPMGTFQSQPMNLQMMADQLNRQRMGYGGAGSQRMEEE